jgi:hypothetical protein
MIRSHLQHNVELQEPHLPRDKNQHVRKTAKSVKTHQPEHQNMPKLPKISAAFLDKMQNKK